MTIRKYLVSGVLVALLAVSPAYAQDDSDEQNEDYMGCGMLGAGVGAAIIAAGTATTANAWTVGLSAALGYGINREIDEYCNEVTQQTVEAYHQDMGITTDYIPDENSNPQTGAGTNAADRTDRS